MKHSRFTKNDEISDEDILNYMEAYYFSNKLYDNNLSLIVYIPTWLDELNKIQFNKLNKSLRSISELVRTNKVIPSLRFLPDVLMSSSKQIWWISPLVIWKEDSVSLLFIDKNGFHVLSMNDFEEVDVLFAFPFDKVDRIEIEDNFEGEPITRLTVFQPDDQGYLTFDETKPSMYSLSHLHIMKEIWEVRKSTVIASKGHPMWAEGAGGEGFKAFESVNELVDKSIWETEVFRPNPSMFGF